MDLSPIKSSTLAKLEPIKPLNVSVPTLPDTPPRQKRSPDGLSEPEAQARKASSLDRLKRLLSADLTGEQEYADGGEVDDPFRSGKPLRTRTRRPATLEENQAMSRAVMQGLANMPYNILGAPGDIANLLAAPTGRQPFYGSEQIKDLATRAGIRPAPPTDPTQAALYGAADIGSALINPAAVTRGAARGAEAIGKGLVETARDFQEYNRRLAVPGASYAVPIREAKAISQNTDDLSKFKDVVEYINPKRIIPPHQPENAEKLNEITQSMKSEGWVGRPILYYDVGQGPEALTGSHRIYAARKAGIDEIPVVKVSGDIGNYVDEFGTAINELKDLDAKQVSRWLKKYGDETAASLMEAEESRKSGGLAALRRE